MSPEAKALLEWRDAWNLEAVFGGLRAPNDALTTLLTMANPPERAELEALLVEQRQAVEALQRVMNPLAIVIDRLYFQDVAAGGPV